MFNFISLPLANLVFPTIVLVVQKNEPLSSDEGIIVVVVVVVTVEHILT